MTSSKMQLWGFRTAREDFRADVYETFSYDAAHRLTKAELHAEADDRKLASKSYAYSAAGNILTKSDTGAAAYAYGAGNAAGPGNAGPHAVVSAGGSRYAYDDNGNMTSGAGRTIAWTSFNKPRFIARAAAGPSPSLADMLRVEFEYGPERRRTRQRRTQGAVDTEITYIGTLYERVSRTGAATRHVRYVFAGGRRVAVAEREEGTPPAERARYLHADHLGSVDAVTSGTGTVLERLSYDAFGARRTAAGASAWRDSAVSISGTQTARGYTDHEHLDVFGLVHMNGRVYDPQLGRFLSADPHVQALGSTQALNRYSYVMNNPLSYTDPSGYFPFKQIKKFLRGVKRGVGKIFRNKVVRVAGAMAFAYWGGSWGANLLFNTKNALAASAVGGFGAGFIASGGNLRAAFVGGLTGAGFGHIGAQSWDFAHKVLAHGAVGGAGAELSGGKFGAGFAGSAFAKLASPQIAAVSSNDIAGAVAAAVVGGTASELAGGKFGNGAMSGAFAYLYNHLEEQEHQRKIKTEADLERFLSEDGTVIRGLRDLDKHTGADLRKAFPFARHEQLFWVGADGKLQNIGHFPAGVISDPIYSFSIYDFADHVHDTWIDVDHLERITPTYDILFDNCQRFCKNVMYPSPPPNFDDNNFGGR